MIRIECKKENGKIVNLTVKGHAESAPYGKDLVCSAVSAVTIGGLNALENPKAFKITTDEKNGLIEIEAVAEVSTHDYQVLDTIFVQLKSIEQTDYSKYIKIIEKGC